MHTCKRKNNFVCTAITHNFVFVFEELAGFVQARTSGCTHRNSNLARAQTECPSAAEEWTHFELYFPGVAVASFQTFAITSMAGLMIKSWRDRINNVATNLAQINSEWEKKRLIGENEIETLKKSQGELQQFLEETEIFAGGVSVPKPVISELDAENVDTKKELEILKEEVKTLRAQIQQLLEENDELRRELKDLKESGKIHVTMLTS